MPKAKSCRCCGTKKKCSGAHVYAIELKPEVITDVGFRKDAGIQEDFNGRCFYVGQTTQHRVECRCHKQHRAKKGTRRKPNASFDCTCKTGTSLAVKFTGYNSGNRYVRNYYQAIAYELFAHHNPLPKKVKATDAEQSLAKQLREQGFAVHFA